MSKANAIPTAQRKKVREREQDRCARCLWPTQTGQWHHRRSRSVRDDHVHCACNGVWLCVTCHTWVHGNPFLARQTGYIVSRHQAEPATVPLTMTLGTRYLDCDGGYKFA